MNNLPSPMIVTELPDGVRYRLPRRPWGSATLFGLGPVVAGVIGIPFISFWLWVVGSNLQLQGGLQAPDAMLIMLLVGGGSMLLMTLRLFLRGLFRIVGRNEVELRDGYLRGVECLGPFRWGPERSIAQLVRFEVRDALPEDRPGRVYEVPRAAAECNVLVALWEHFERPLARGYPRSWLLPLADDLARRCRLATDSERPIPVAEEPLPNPAGFVELVDQPEESRIIVERIGDGLTLTLPRAKFGWRQTVITLLGDRLRVEKRGKSHEWTPRQLADVRVARLVDSEGPDGFEVHIDPHPGEGDRVRLATSGEAEARWLATTLRRGLGMTDAGDEPAPFLERPDRPAGCRIVEEPHGDGVQFVAPPVGYRNPTVRFHLRLAVGCLTLSWAFAAGLAYILGFDDVQLVWLLPCLISVVGILGFEAAVRRALQQVSLTLTEDMLIARQTNLYGTREQKWRRTWIEDVRVGDTLEGRTSPRMRRAALDRTEPTWELHIHLADGTIVRLLDGYGDAELQWLATALRRALGTPVGSVPLAPGFAGERG